MRMKSERHLYDGDEKENTHRNRLFWAPCGWIFHLNNTDYQYNYIDGNGLFTLPSQYRVQRDVWTALKQRSYECHMQATAVYCWMAKQQQLVRCQRMKIIPEVMLTCFTSSFHPFGPCTAPAAQPPLPSWPECGKYCYNKLPPPIDSHIEHNARLICAIEQNIYSGGLSVVVQLAVWANGRQYCVQPKLSWTNFCRAHTAIRLWIQNAYTIFNTRDYRIAH